MAPDNLDKCTSPARDPDPPATASTAPPVAPHAAPGAAYPVATADDTPNLEKLKWSCSPQNAGSNPALSDS